MEALGHHSWWFMDSARAVGAVTATLGWSLGLVDGPGGLGKHQEGSEHFKWNLRMSQVAWDHWRSPNPPSLLPGAHPSGSCADVSVSPGKEMHVPSKGRCG